DSRNENKKGSHDDPDLQSKRFVSHSFTNLYLYPEP
ncbi:unnamed protein product, partial [marine sediment metagenome]